MSVMAIPDGGLHLESSEMSESLPMQAFGITLNDLVIEDLISCIQSGKQIELHLGNSPVSCTPLGLCFAPLSLLRHCSFLCLRISRLALGRSAICIQNLSRKGACIEAATAYP